MFPIIFPFLELTSKLTFCIKFQDFESKNGNLFSFKSLEGFKTLLGFEIGFKFLKFSYSSILFILTL